MANKILWDAKPTGTVIMAASGGPLRALANDGIAVSDEVNNGTDLNDMAAFELYVHDFAAAPDSGGYFECHIVYQLDGTNYADGEDGDVGDPNLGMATLVGTFPVVAVDEDPRIQLIDIPIPPFDFKACVVNKSGDAIPDTDNSKLTIWTYSHEVQ